MQLLRKQWRTFAAAATGAALGAAYAHFIGCRTGTCPLTSNVWTASLYGGLTGAWAGWPDAREGDMPRNVGAIDRVVRVVIGIVLISLVFVGPHTPWGLVGLVPLGTALAGYCPLYSLLGIRRRTAP